MAGSMAEASSEKELGNQMFTSGSYEDALVHYTKAVELSSPKEKESAVFYKNRAACYLKLNKYDEAASDATKALELLPNDPKSLFRRCQAFEQLGKSEEAYKDARLLLHVDPRNKAIQPILGRLTAVIKKKAENQLSTNNQMTQMFNVAFDSQSQNLENRIRAINNLIVLAREESGALRIYKEGGVPRLIELLKEKEPSIIQGAVRVLSCLTKYNKERAMVILKCTGLGKLCALMGSPNEDICIAVSHLIQSIINGLTDLENFRENYRKHQEHIRKNPQGRKRFEPLQLDDEMWAVVDEIINACIKMLNNGKVSKYGRDVAMELLIKVVTADDGLNWSKKFINTDGVTRLLEVAGAVEHHKTLEISKNTRAHSSVLLSKVYDDLLSDKHRDIYRDTCNKYFTEMFGDDLMESKLEAIMSISALLQGPYDVGNSILGTQGVLEIMLTMANSNDPIYQKTAVEALAHAASKKDKCSGIVKQAVPILKRLYQSNNDNIKVRALVGLCKLGSYGGTDASAKSLADGSTQTLAKACRRFLVNPAKDIDLRKWACEGLAYLTLDADVKEELVADTPAIHSLIDLAQAGDRSVLYPAATIFVNLTNSYDVEEVVPEMVELAKFAKQHIPEDHVKDKGDYVAERCKKLVNAGVGAALVALSNTDSKSSKELLSRVFLAVLSDTDHRGLLVSQGAGKALIPLALDGTDKGTAKAAQALAKIAITTNPEIAFPGQRCLEVVRPVMSLLNLDCSALQNFEALLALTNLASLSPSVRKRIFKEKGIGEIEHYMYEEHELLKRASVECMCNMILEQDVRDIFLEENDRVKLWTLYCADEDYETARASAGGLAMLTQNEKICQRITKVNSFHEILMGIMASDQPEMQHRATCIVLNMMCANKEVAEIICDTKLLEVLMAVSKLESPETKPARENALKALKEAAGHGLIKANEA